VEDRGTGIMEEEQGAGVEEERSAGVMEEERGADVEDERGVSVEVHMEDVEEGRQRGGLTMEGGRRGGAGVGRCGEKTGLGFRGSGALKKKNSSNEC
jgi:hypothetical protein